MDRRQLSKDDRETIELELKNSTNVRQKKILTGTLTSIGGLMFTVTFYYLNMGRIGAAITLVSFMIMTYGLFNIASWTMFSKSIKKLKDDFDNGFKFVGKHKIKSYNFLTKKVILDNGMKLDSFEINDEWNPGDELHIEKLPTSNFIIRCDKNVN